VPAALYALAGTVIGILGTVLADAIRERRQERLQSQEALRTACSDFMAQVARVRRYSLTLRLEPQNQETWLLTRGAFTEARAHYERLLITADSLATQEAARHVIHFVYWMSRAAHGDITGFAECHDELRDWTAKPYAEVRRELRLRHPDAVYKDPPGSFNAPGQWIEKPPSSKEAEPGVVWQRSVIVAQGWCHSSTRRAMDGGLRPARIQAVRAAATGTPRIVMARYRSGTRLRVLRLLRCPAASAR
jgi:hypothetical protein